MAATSSREVPMPLLDVGRHERVARRMMNREDLAMRSARVRRYALVMLHAEGNGVLGEPVVQRCAARRRR